MTMTEKIPIRGLAKDITAASTDTPIYERTSGRKLYITGLVITNQNTTNDATVDFYDGASTGGRKLLTVIVPSGSTTTLNKNVLGDSVYCEYGDLVAQSDQTTVTVTPSGYEE